MNRETEIDLNQFVPKVQFELIPIKNLVSNQDYQRNLIYQTCSEGCFSF